MTKSNMKNDGMGNLGFGFIVFTTVVFICTIMDNILSPIGDWIWSRLGIKRRIALIKCGYNPFYKAWSFKKWYTHNWKYYKSGLSYTHPSYIKEDQFDEITMFYKWE